MTAWIIAVEHEGGEYFEAAIFSTKEKAEAAEDAVLAKYDADDPGYWSSIVYAIEVE